MNFSRLNLNLLVSLDALLSERSVTRAAERVRVSQPGMSASLRTLREYLNDPLLERVGRELELTPRGKDLVGPVRELLLRIQSVLSAPPTFDHTTANRTFRGSMSGYLVQLAGVPCVRFLTENARGINFELEDLAADSLRRVEEGELDICVTIPDRTGSRPLQKPELLSSERLFSDSFVLVAAQDNSSVREHLSYAEFCEMQYVEVRFSGEFVGMSERVLQRQERRPTVQAWLPTSQNVLAAVSNSMAVAIVPLRLYKIYKSILQLKCIQPPFEIPPIEMRCFWHSRNDLDPGHQWFRNLFRTVAIESFDGSNAEGDGVSRLIDAAT